MKKCYVFPPKYRHFSNFHDFERKKKKKRKQKEFSRQPFTKRSSLVSLHHNGNEARFFSPEIESTSCLTSFLVSCQIRQEIGNEEILRKLQN